MPRITFFKFLFWDIPENFEDLGEVCSIGEKIRVHSLCGTRARVGKFKKDGQIFLYCPRCKVVTEIND